MKRKSRNRILSIFLAVLIVGGGLVLYRLGVFSKKDPDPGASEAAARPTAMLSGRTIPAKGLLIQSGAVRDAISVNGSTTANEVVMVSSELPGKITKIFFQEGGFVKRGAPLVQLDVDELKAQRDRLVVRQQLTRSIAERLQGLYQKEGVSLQEYEIARAEADQVDAELALIDVQIDKRTVRAPFDGLLGLRQVSEGSYLAPGMTIVSLVNVNPINVEFSVPERYVRVADKGTRVSFQLDGISKAYEAVVIAKEPNVDPTTRTLRLKASAPNPGGQILPGAFANVQVSLRFFDNAIMVPTQAVIPEMGGRKVFVYRDGKAVSMQIETGIRQEEEIQVVSGLQAGDTLIITGMLQLQDGMNVSLTEVIGGGS